MPPWIGTVLGDWNWRNLSAAADPGTGNVGVFNAAQICLSTTTLNLGDVTAALAAVAPLDTITLQTRGDAASWSTWQVNSSDPMGAWHQLLVGLLETSAVVPWGPSQNADVLVIWNPAVPPPGPGAGWITGPDLAQYVGADYGTDPDPDRFDARADAANAWCYRRRAAYAYTDDPTTVPNAAVRDATLMFGSIILRDQGAYDGALSFSEFPGVTTSTGGSMGTVNKLLGVPRAVVA